MQERTCKCGTSFVVPHPSSKKLNCSAKCRGVKNKRRSDAGQRKSEWVDLVCGCGKEFAVPAWEVRSDGRKYCSPECRRKYRLPGSGRPRRVDRERYVTNDGYVRIYVPPAERAPGWEKKSHHPEHRIVMAGIIGRHLAADENVHHLNGNRRDNRPENLELWARRQPKGQRALDLLVYAEDIIALYGPVRQVLR